MKYRVQTELTGLQKKMSKDSSKYYIQTTESKKICKQICHLHKRGNRLSYHDSREPC